MNYIPVFLHLCWICTDDLTSPAALVGPTPPRHSLYLHAQRVENIFSSLRLTEFSQGNMKVQAVYLEISYPCPSATPGRFKANNQTEHDCLRNLWNHVPRRTGWFQRTAALQPREGGINQMSHLDWDSNGSTLLFELACWNQPSCCTRTVIQFLQFSLSALWQTRECISSTDSKVRDEQTNNKQQIFDVEVNAAFLVLLSVVHWPVLLEYIASLIQHFF